MIKNEVIIISPTKPENLSEIIKIEKKNSDFIGQDSLEKHQDILANKNEKHFSLFDKTDNSLIGFILLAGFTDKNDSIEFRRIAISKKGVGFGKNAIKLIKKMSFDLFKAHRLWLDVFDDNKRAISLYEKEGFQKEGKLRDCMKKDGDYRSVFIMSILDYEYKLNNDN